MRKKSAFYFEHLGFQFYARLKSIGELEANPHKTSGLGKIFQFKKKQKTN